MNLSVDSSIHLLGAPFYFRLLRSKIQTPTKSPSWSVCHPYGKFGMLRKAILQLFPGVANMFFVLPRVAPNGWFPFGFFFLTNQKLAQLEKHSNFRSSPDRPVPLPVARTHGRPRTRSRTPPLGRSGRARLKQNQRMAMASLKSWVSWDQPTFANPTGIPIRAQL